MENKNNYWIGCDLDGTLAEYTEWKGASHIGAPIPVMVERVKMWLSQGIDVRIFTARVSSNNPEREESEKAIKAWCFKHLGIFLPITAEKDYFMKELWDDRCVQVIPNKGIAVQEFFERILANRSSPIIHTGKLN
jgi:hypothetical protein